MRKYKIKSLISLMFVLTLVVAGCGKDGEGEQSSETNPDDYVQETPNYIYELAEKPTFYTGDVITFDSVAEIDPTVAGTETATGFFGTDGSFSDSMELTEVGIQTIQVAVQYLDGTSEIKEIQIEVLDSKSIPDELQANIASGKWYTGDIQAYSYNSDNDEFDKPIDISDAVQTISSIDVTYLNTESIDRLFGINMITSEKNAMWVVAITDDATMDLMTQNHINPATNHELTYWISIMSGLMSAIGNNEDDMAQAQLYMDYMTQFIDSISQVNNSQTAYFVYDIDGNAYPVYETTISIDKSLFGGVTETTHGIFYFDIPTTDGSSSYRCYINPLYDKEWSVEVQTSIDETDEDTETEVPDIANYDDFVTYIQNDAEFKSMINSKLDHSMLEYSESLSRFVNHFILGDVNKLSPPENQITTEDGSGEGEEIQDAISEVVNTYASRFPEIYTWPANDTKYSRWVYTVDEQTNFNSSITFPDGTVIISSNKDTENDWSIDTTDPNAQLSGGGGMTESSAKTVDTTVTSSYGVYNISYKGNGASVSDMSTASRAAIDDGNQTYMFESGRATLIQNYLADNIYAQWNDLSFTDYQIVEKPAVNGDLGKITPYVIYYENGTKSAPYMAVYNINNDYIICYAKNMESSEDVFVDLLQTCVSIK